MKLNFINFIKTCFSINPKYESSLTIHDTQILLLIFSSCLFLIPFVYAYYLQRYEYSILLLLVWISSVNFWNNANKPNNTIRRTLDLIISKFAVFVFSITGVLLMPFFSIIILFCLEIVLSLLFFLGNWLWTQNYNYWVIIHMLFHILAAFLVIYVLYFSFHCQYVNKIDTL